MMKRNTLCLAVSLALAATVAHADDWRAKTSPSVQQKAAAGELVDVLIELRDAPDLSLLAPGEFADKVSRAGLQLEAVAERSQRDLRAALDARGIEYRAYWIANAIAARVSPSDLAWIAVRPEVKHVASDAPRRMLLPPNEGTAQVKAVTAVGTNVAAVNAPQVWAAGFSGQGVVIAGQDTGYQWDHPALKDKYRGWNGTTADHNYNWHDSIHAALVSGTNPCGLNAVAPCDDNSHGTHTMGTMVGDDGGTNQVGVAPGAKWISCRNMERGNGRPSTYIECFQWFIAPTNLSNGAPDPTKAPHIISNSWGCPPEEECQIDSLQQAVSNTRAAGILVVVAAGNGTATCGSISDPPAIYADSFTIGATNDAGTIASFSLRGPVTVDGSNRLKPDVTAPGVSVRSTVPGNSYGSKSGTSMATPAAAGVAALLMSADPSLKGNPAAVEQLLRQTAIGTTSLQTCGSFPGSAIPNTTFGYGRIDAWAAFQALQPAAPPLLLDGFE